MIRFLDALRGHRTFCLICVVLIPYAAVGLYLALEAGSAKADLQAYRETLSFVGGVIRDAGIGLGISKAGSAAKTYAARSPVTQEEISSKVEATHADD